MYYFFTVTLTATLDTFQCEANSKFMILSVICSLLTLLYLNFVITSTSKGYRLHVIYDQ